MNDLLELVAGVLICTVPPVALVALIVYAMRASKASLTADKVADLEDHIASINRDNYALRHRLERVEGYLNQLERARAAGELSIGAPKPAAPPIEIAASAPAPMQAELAAAAPPISAVTEPPSEVAAPPAEEAAPPAEEAAPPAVEAAPPAVETAPPAEATAPAAAATEAGAPPFEAPPAPPVEATPPPVQPPPVPPKPSIGWERWIGVRGAAALGASILVLAGIYFFEYSIEHGLITPAMRMIAGTIVGLACVLGSELRLRKTHSILSNWLEGAGIAILYVAFWAGTALYHLYPTWAATILMVAVTAACVTLALKRDAPSIAVLGLLGGFITPIALSTGTDRPYALFGYILLLDGAMLWLAYKRRWAWMAILCLIATAMYQNAWLFARLDEPRLILGVAIVVVFAALFVALPRSSQIDDKGEENVVWKLARSAGVVLPLIFTIPLAARSDIGDTYWPTVVQLVLLCAAACWVGRRHKSAILPSGAALLAIGTLMGLTIGQGVDAPLDLWKLSGLAIALAIVFHAFAEVDRGIPHRGSIPAGLYTVSILVIAMLAAPFVLDEGGLWPWLALWIVAVALGQRLAGFPDRRMLSLAVSGLAALGLGATFVAQSGDSDYPSPALFAGILVAFAAAMHVAGLVRRDAEGRRYDDHAAALFAAILIPLLAMGDDRDVPSWALYASTLVLAVLALFAVARRRMTAWMPVILALTAFAHGVWVMRRSEGPFSALELVPLGAAVLLFSIAPIFMPRAVRDEPWAWRTSALAGPLYLLTMRHVYVDALGAETIGLLPVALGLVSIGAAYAVRARGPEPAEARRVALVWLTATAAGFVTLAIPFQLEQEWITIGWALEALVLTALWHRFDHPGLKYMAFALAGAVCVRLVFNPYVLDYYPRQGFPILNWLTYTYLVPAATLFGMWGILRHREIERRRAWEKPFFPSGHALLANIAAAAGIVVLFIWVNLSIYDYFGTERDLVIAIEHQPARDLTQSIAWAIFALALLAFGLWRKSTALRITSLGLILLTCAKAFLYDVSHLADLYRVASLAGLAVALLVISFAYHRFVFRDAASEEAK